MVVARYFVPSSSITYFINNVSSRTLTNSSVENMTKEGKMQPCSFKGIRAGRSGQDAHFGFELEPKLSEYFVLFLEHWVISVCVCMCVCLSWF